MTSLPRIIDLCDSVHIGLLLAGTAFFLAAEARCHGDDQGAPLAASVDAWIQGLEDPSYRTRRESFLKLCDRTIPIDAWLDKEARSGDKHRSAVAIWLKRLRLANGTLTQRAEILRDYETLRSPDDRNWDRASVIERYVTTGQWEGLLELVALLDPPTRTELLGEDHQLQSIISKAWKTENEWVVPRLLDLVLKPSERIQANRLWRTLGMPEEWKVSLNRNLPSVKVLELEADSKIDEAVALAEKSGLRNLIEPMLVRANRWDRWLTMDPKRTPIAKLGSFDHQKALMLMLTGRLQESEILLDKIVSGSERSNLSNGSGLLALGLGRTEEFEKFLGQQKDSSAFHLMRMLGHVHAAFEQVGLDDLSVESVQAWLEKNGKKWLSEELDARQQKPKASPLADFADLFFQIGLNKQGELIDTLLIEWIKKREVESGIDAWMPTFGQWLVTNERVKVIYHWKDFLIRTAGRRVKAGGSKLSPYELIYTDFPQSASWMVDHLVGVANKTTIETVTDVERQRKAIEQAIEWMEDFHAGRRPRGWDGQRPLLDLRNAIYTRSLESGDTDRHLLEIAKLFDCLDETQLAIECLELCSADSVVNRAKAEFLIRLGKLDVACDLLVEEFQNDPSDVELFVECTETLENVGRFSEMDRFRLQGLSSMIDDASSSRGSELELPVRKIVQMVFERRLHRDKLEIGSGFYPARCLSRQYGESAKKDLSHAKNAAKSARIETLLWIKILSEDPSENSRLFFSLYGDAFQPSILEAISEGDRELADTLYRVAFRCKPEDIDMPIAVIPHAEKAFGKELADEWFDLFYQPMLKHLEEFSDDTLIGNNTAWLAALCNRNLEKAQYLASKVAVSNPDPTYLDTLAEVEYRMGHVERAIEISERCLLLKPKDKQHREQLKRFRTGKP